jgi:hypothetical protein
MPSPVVLKMVNRRLAELTRQYTAIRTGDPRALAIAEEFSQIGTVRDEIQRIQEKLGCSGQPPKSSPSKSPTVGTLLRRMDKLARQFPEMPREYPGRSEIVNEITRLTFLADSLFKSKNSHITGAQCERSGNGAEEGVELDFD